MEWYQEQLTSGREKGKGIFHDGSWERLHDKLIVLTFAAGGKSLRPAGFEFLNR